MDFVNRCHKDIHLGNTFLKKIWGRKKETNF